MNLDYCCLKELDSKTDANYSEEKATYINESRLYCLKELDSKTEVNYSEEKATYINECRMTFQISPRPPPETCTLACKKVRVCSQIF